MAVQAHHQLQCDLTCNPSTSKKRRLHEIDTSQQCIPHLFIMLQQQQQQQSHGSISTSTNGWNSASHELLSQFCQQGVELDTLLRLQVERVRSEVEAVSKRQCRDLFLVLRQQAQKMMKDKDAEIERASRRNMELERKVRELAAQSQLWFTAAKNSEALACNLKSTLEQALQNAASTALSDDCDAESCCYEGVDEKEELRRRTACKVCGEKEVCALILPCRHLCLCKDCEPVFDTCPVCDSIKSASLHIFFP